MVELPALHPDHDAVGGGADLLADAVELAGGEGGHDREGEAHRAGGVADHGAGDHRLRVGLADHVGDAAAHLGVLVGHALVAVGALVAEAVGDAVDEALVALRQFVVAQTHALERILAEVADEDVGAVDEAHQDLSADLRVDVERD